MRLILRNDDSIPLHKTHGKSLSLCEIMLPHYLYKVCYSDQYIVFDMTLTKPISCIYCLYYLYLNPFNTIIFANHLYLLDY